MVLGRQGTSWGTEQFGKSHVQGLADGAMSERHLKRTTIEGDRTMHGVGAEKWESPIPLGRHRGYRYIGFLALMFMLVTMWQMPDEAKATNATCNFPNPIWYCEWRNNPLAPETPLYYNATPGDNAREWWQLGVKDGHSGSVAAKCVGRKLAANGYVETLVCGAGSPAVEVDLQPSYAWIWHDAPSARRIIGYGVHI